MTGLILTKWSVSDFLNQYRNERTRSQYLSHLKYYFGCFFPHLLELYLPELTEELDKVSLQYLNSERDIRQDLIKYANTIENFTPKTRILKLNAVFRYLEDNGIDIPKVLRRNIVGQEKGAVSEEFIPKPEDLKKVIEHVSIADKALILVLSSSGMRIGEALKLTLDDLSLDHDPPKIILPAHITKTKKNQY